MDAEQGHSDVLLTSSKRALMMVIQCLMVVMESG